LFSIKSSFADCSKCELLGAKSCILETNCEDDLTKVDVIFVAENPGKVEIEKEVPLIGKAGQLFRRYFEKHKFNETNYLLTNSVLCQTIKPDGTTSNPSDEVINRCKVNCQTIIDICKPKLIVLIGSSALKAFGIAEFGITKIAGETKKWNGYDVFIMLHPSYVNRQINKLLPKFERDFEKLAYLYFGENKNKKTKRVKKEISNDDNNFYYKIPEKYYSGDYRLVDVQTIGKKILYIFRDKDNKKHYYSSTFPYVCYYLNDEETIPEIMVPFSELERVEFEEYFDSYNLDKSRTYNGDIKPEVLHAIDYYHQSKDEPVSNNMNVMFCDIEVYTETNDFPDPVYARSPITIITYRYNDIIETLVFDLFRRDTSKINLKNVKFYKDEKSLIFGFFKRIKELDPDILTGWNFIHFDIAYLVNRCRTLKIPLSSITKFGEIYVDLSNGVCDFPGYVVLDQLMLYKNFVFGSKESYKLDSIAKEELGESKVEIENFNTVFKNDLKRAIEYNIQDVELVYKLEKKLRFVSLQNEIRVICNSTFRNSSTPFGQLDSLLTTRLKKNGIAVRNSIHISKEKFEGAFVKEPIKGLHNWVVDFDFSSLYPSLILTYNIGVNTLECKLDNDLLSYNLMYDRSKLPDKVKVIYDPVYSKQEKDITKEELVELTKKYVYTINGCFYKKHEEEISFYAKILDDLISRRKEFKKMMFEAKKENDNFKYDLYYNRQLVYKILANAMYGVLGNPNFRFFNIDCARSITMSGQEAIKQCIIEANAYVNKLKTGKYEKPKQLEVSEIFKDLSRYTENIITSDTDSIFVKLEKLIDNNWTFDVIKEKILSWCDEIQSFLNNEIISNLVRKRNVDISTNKLSLKNEFVIKRGLFLAKKRYACYVILQEGVKTDEIDVKGIEIKRSDYPHYTKVLLQELLNILLKDEYVQVSKLLNTIKKAEESIIRMLSQGDLSVARPVSWSKKLENYKVIPQAVKGMINWNELVYDYFTHGSKGYLFKILGLDLDKAPEDVKKRYIENFINKDKLLTEIVVPIEEKNLPNYFVIDLKAMVKLAWTDRYKLLIDPIVNIEKENLVLTF